jgi:hypothetical protein
MSLLKIEIVKFSDAFRRNGTMEDWNIGIMDD